jgi:hypothetical protein
LRRFDDIFRDGIGRDISQARSRPQGKRLLLISTSGALKRRTQGASIPIPPTRRHCSVTSHRGDISPISR